MQEVISAVLSGLVELVFAVAGAAFTAIFIPWLVKTGIPWLKEKRLYATVEKFVEAAEKLAETGVLEKADKKQYVIDLLEAKGVTVTDEVDAIIEAAVKELDVFTQQAVTELSTVFQPEAEEPEE